MQLGLLISGMYVLDYLIYYKLYYKLYYKWFVRNIRTMKTTPEQR
jgi:hypothetical protein